MSSMDSGVAHLARHTAQQLNDAHEHTKRASAAAALETRGIAHKNQLMRGCDFIYLTHRLAVLTFGSATVSNIAVVKVVFPMYAELAIARADPTDQRNDVSPISDWRRGTRTEVSEYVAALLPRQSADFSKKLAS